jgi:hypothetical protein
MMAELIKESEMLFGEYEINDLFRIETSKIYEELGSGVKTVEFILKQKNMILFLEAKKSCPNAANKNDSDKKMEDFEEFYSSVTEKFVDSLQIFLAYLTERYPDTSEVGTNLVKQKTLKDINLRFVLVITNAELGWLAGPKAILEERLIKYRRIWNVEVAVLNSDLAREYKLVVA